MTHKTWQDVFKDGKLHHVLTVDGHTYVDGTLRPDLVPLPPEIAKEQGYDWYKQEAK